LLRRVRYTVCLLMLGLQVGWPASWQSDTLWVTPQDSVLSTSSGYILPSSLSIQALDSSAFRIESLIVESLTGQIRGFDAPDDSLQIVLCYQYLDVRLPKRSVLTPPPRVYLPKTNAESESIFPNRPDQMNPDALTSYDFLKSGSVFRGFSLGSQSGFALKSGLNLELGGKITEDISIIGSLTDQNLPIQPEGNTQTLEEIDKVFIQVEMPHERISFGDYELQLANGELGRYRRKLQGISLRSERGNSRVELAGAVTKGQYQSQFFMGEEGKQGPYQLTGKEGETAIILLAGTERIWVDGKVMQRGENADYVIDYSTAEITFTPDRLITAESRITADFQYSNLVYSKNIWTASASTKLLDDKLQIATAIINESDDRDNPIEISLSDADRAVLRQAGDNSAASLVSTIRKDSTGSYVLEDSILVYIGSGAGTHSATFYNVGRAGSYRKSYDVDRIYFQYVDKSDPDVSDLIKDEARYLPVRPLRLPEKHRQYHFTNAWTPSENLQIRSELAVSQLDQNTFSGLDDGDNTGSAVRLDANLKIPLRDAGELSILGNFRNESLRFQSVDRRNVVEYRRKWDLPSDSTQGQQVWQTALHYRYRDYLRANLEGGIFQMGELGSQRYAMQTILHYQRLEKAEFRSERIQRSTDIAADRVWVRNHANAVVGIGPFKAFSRIDHERRETPEDSLAAFQFVDQSYGIMTGQAKRAQFRLAAQFRRDDGFRSQRWQSNSVARNLRLEGNLRNWKGLSGEWNYTYRKKLYQYGETPDLAFHLLRLGIRYQPRKAPLRIESNMKIEEEQTVKKEWRYFFVGKGEGQYLYDSTFADYRPDPQGDYVLRITPSDVRQPVTSIQNGLRLQFQGSTIRKASLQWLRRFSAVSDIRLKQQISAIQNPLQEWAWSPATVDQKWTYFQRVVQQDINYQLRQMHGYLRLRYQDSEQISSLDVRGADRNHTRYLGLRYRGDFIAALKLESELRNKQLIRQSEFNSLSNRDLQSIIWENLISYRWDRRNFLRLEILLNYDEEQSYSRKIARLWGLEASYERKMQGKGRWRGFVELDRVTVTPEGMPLPWEMSQGKKEGSTLGFGGLVEYRIGNHLSIRFHYEGWNEPHRPLYHLGGGEIRALF